MKILLYGEYWSGTSVDAIANVLLKKKIDHRIFDFYKMINPDSGNKIANKILRRILYKKNEALINKLLLEELEKYRPTILLISKGINIYPETILKFKNSSVLVSNWNPDDFFNPRNSSRHLQNSLNLYDYVFSARKHLFDEYMQAGIQKPVYLEWYYIPWLHRKNDEITALQKKITFIGTYSKRREYIIRSIDKSFPVEIWGAGWSLSGLRFQKNVQLKNEILKQESFPEIMSSSMINLNILTTENRDLTNLKLFEITASYGCLLTEQNEVSEFILENTCYYYDFNKKEQLNEKIDELFSLKETDYLSLRESGYAKVTQGFNSIEDRVTNIIETIDF